MKEAMNDSYYGDQPSLRALPQEEILHRVSTRIATDEKSHLYHVNCQTDATPDVVLEGTDWKVVVDLSGDEGQTIWAFAVRDNATVGVNYNKGPKTLDAWVCSYESAEHAVVLGKELARKAPAIPKPPKEQVAVRFWNNTSNGPTWNLRQLTAPKWDDVERNYPSGSREPLAEIMSFTAPPTDAGGRLLLLHGPPGTGKTHIIRAIAQEWEDWCSTHYIIDPDRFFGDSSYMINVLLDTSTDFDNPFDDDDGTSTPAHLWRLIVIEDADELLRADAKEKVGQALSRLLNICDGLIGQGLRVMVLITTNEPIEHMHAAILRPGRCLANIHIAEFSAREGSAWLDAKVDRDMTLAELYEHKANEQVVARSKGFVSGQYL